LFSEVLVPPAVLREIAAGSAIPRWILERPLSQPIGPQILGASLGPGESEAVALALEVKSGWIILDERPARRVAQGLGLPVIGTLGIFLAGKRRGLLAVVRPTLDALAERGFRIAPKLYERVLADAGEGPRPRP
jgi:predicted nucleic acid-binding protein